MATPRADIDPSLLRWARTSIGYSVEDAAAKLRLRGGVDQLEAWEAGEGGPTVAQLRKVAQVYRRPLAVFFLPEPPRDFQAMRDFRRIPGAEAGRWSPNLHSAVIRAGEQREALRELVDVLGDDLSPIPSVEISEDADAVAAQIRKLIGVPLSAQVGWGRPDVALKTWIAAVEATGVLVLQAQGIDVDEMRGFALSDDSAAVIVLNGGDSRRGRIFTLLHEFVHVVLRSSGVCDLFPIKNPRSETDKTEVFCNRVAASVLLPKEEFLADRLVANREGENWDDLLLKQLGDRYSVSREVILRRLLTLGKTTFRFYQEKHQEFIEEYKTLKEKKRAARKKPRIPYYRLKVRDLGRPYVELALDAYRGRAISTSEAADYLDVPVKGITRIEQEVGLTSGAE
ncbi:MAG TPA: XRE family transcriptional regulator [Solirubrobacterales bacterium]|nr:XRE family transcriptional regulator [Solirubrobacterales bacterium]